MKTATEAMHTYSHELMVTWFKTHPEKCPKCGNSFPQGIERFDRAKEMYDHYLGKCITEVSPASAL